MSTAGAAPPEVRVSLLRALAGATPAFTGTPIQVSSDMTSADRMILALAETTPAFVPDFDARPERGSGGHRWHGKPLAMVVALGVVLGICSAALVVLPDDTTSTADTVRNTTSVPTLPTTTTAVIPPPVTTTTDTATPGALAGLQVAPAEVTLTAGERARLTATGSYDDGSTADLTARASWSSADPRAVEVDGTGTVTAVGGPPPEVLRIRINATVDGISGAATVVLTPPEAPSTTAVTSTQTTTVTTTVPSPTVTSTETTTVVSTITSTVPGPPVTQTYCVNGSTAIAPQSCPEP